MIIEMGSQFFSRAILIAFAALAVSAGACTNSARPQIAATAADVSYQASPVPPHSSPSGESDTSSGVSSSEAVARGLFETDYGVSLRFRAGGGATLQGNPFFWVLPGFGPASLYFEVENSGIYPDRFSIEARSALGFTNLSEVPDEVELEPGEVVAISISVTIPSDTASGAVEVILVTVVSQSSPFRSNVGRVTFEVGP